MGQRGVVLRAGGPGTRMGAPKGQLDLAGPPIAAGAAAALWTLCGSVLVSVAAGATNPAPQHPAVADDPPAGRGPLAGIHAAFRATGEADLLILACDYPRMTPAGLQALGDRADAARDLVIAVDRAGRDHPLVGLWRRSCVPHGERALSERMYKVRALLPDVETVRVGPDDVEGVDLDGMLINVNHPEDLLRL